MPYVVKIPERGGGEVWLSSSLGSQPIHTQDTMEEREQDHWSSRDPLATVLPNGLFSCKGAWETEYFVLRVSVVGAGEERQ